MSYIKPQTPLQHKDGDYFYPLTTIDQVIMEDGITRLNGADLVSVNTDGAPEGETVKVNADTLGGYPASDFVRYDELDMGDIGSGNGKTKAGFIYPLASSVVPEGFLLCDGAEYLRAEYPELFAAIGTIYGEGNGSTTFNVPNLQTRVPIGKGDGYVLGTTGGEEKHTLTVEEMPSHDHYLPMYVSTGNSKPGASVGYSENCGGTQWATSGYVGGSQPHNNMQPYTVVNYIIATGKDTGVNVSDIVLGAQAIPLGIEYGGTGATTVEDARKNLGIKDTVLVAPKNLLDNSDFTNPVNQRGVTAISAKEYHIDRWRAGSNRGIASITTDGLELTNTVTSGLYYYEQVIGETNDFLGKVVTGVAYLSNGEIAVASGVFPADDVTENTQIAEVIFGDGCSFRLHKLTETQHFLYQFVIPEGLNTMVKRVAVYQGEYTVETLPEYRPKGYGAELAECQRYFFPFNMTLGGIITEGRTILRVTIPLPITMRITPTISNFNASGIRHVGGASIKPTVKGVRIGVYDNCVAVMYECNELTQMTNNTPIAGYFSGELSADY